MNSRAMNHFFAMNNRVIEIKSLKWLNKQINEPEKIENKNTRLTEYNAVYFAIKCFFKSSPKQLLSSETQGLYSVISYSLLN